MASCARFRHGYLRSGEGYKRILHLLPDAGVGIDELKVSGAGKRDQLNVLAGFFLFGGVGLADFVGHCVVGGAVNEPLRGLWDRTLRWRSFTIMVWDFRRRAAKKCCGSIIAQMQLPGAMQVYDAREREHMRNGPLKSGEAESEVASGGVAGDAEVVQVEPGDGIVFVLAQSVVGAADVFKRSRPAAAGISHATVLHIPGRDAGVFQRVAKMTGVSKVVFGAPETAVDKENDRMRAFSGGKACLDELIRVLPVRKAQIGFRRFLVEDSFALHAEQYRTARLQDFTDERFEQVQKCQFPKACSKLSGRVYWGGRPPECDGAEDCAGGL